MSRYLKFMTSKRIVLAIVFVMSMGAVFAQGGKVALSDNCPGNPPQTPAFNVWPLTYDPTTPCADLALIDAKNLSSSDPRNSRYAQSQAEHDSGISAAVGDTVRISIYFHNGASDQIARSQTTARNVTLASNFSTSATTDHFVSGSISASNASTVSSSSLGGDIAIHTGSTQTTLVYVPGSTMLCINQTAIPSGLSVVGSCGVASDGTPRVLVQMPDGIANGAVGIGDVLACFPFAGTLVYSVTVQTNNPPPPGNGQLTVVKTVRNVTKGEATFAPSTNALQNEIVNFQIQVTNTGNATVNNVVVSDNLPNGMNFQSGVSASLFVGGLPLGNLAPGQSASVNFMAQVTATSGTLTNTAIATGSGVPNVQSQATVFVTQGPPPAQGSLSITKQVRNQTTGSAYGASTSAQQGQTVGYQIVVTNTSSATITNVIIQDPSTPGITVDASGAALASGQNVGALSPNQSVTKTYSGIVNAGSGSTLVNTATARGDNVTQVQASATVTVGTNPPPAQATLTITKMARDIARGETTWTNTVNALNGDTVDFQITVTNTGSTTANNVMVYDQLPSGLNLASSSPRPEIVNWPGTALGNIAAGQSAVITISVQVNAGQLQTATFVNTATASADNATQVQAQATVTLSQPGKTKGSAGARP